MDWFTDFFSKDWIQGIEAFVALLIVLGGGIVIVWRRITRHQPSPQPVRVVETPPPQPPPAPKPPAKLLGPVALEREVQGRAAEVTRLREALEYGGAAAIVTGTGGIGKTTLARAYADAYRDAYDGVLWLRAEEETTLIDDALMLGPALGLAPDGSVPKPQRARAALDALPAGWLVVYDNATDDKAVARWLANPPVHVLVTSRHTAWPAKFAEVAPEALACDRADAPGPRLLMQEAGRRDDPEGARALAEALGGLPLALVAAGGLIRETGGGWADYAGRLEAVLAEVPRGDYPDAVIGAVKLSYDALETDARTVLDLFAWMAPEGLEARLLTDVPGSERLGALAVDLSADRLKLCADAPRVAAALRAAARCSLMRREGDGYALHRMSAAALRALQGARGEREATARASAAVLAAGYPHVYTATFPVCARLTPHVLALAASWDGMSEPGRPGAPVEYLLNQGAIYLLQMAEVEAALRLAEQSLSLKQARLPESHPDVALGWSTLGETRGAAGDLQGALAAQARAVSLGETHGHGPEMLSTLYNNHAAALRDLGRATGDRGLFEDALQRDEQALALREKAFGADSDAVANSLANLSKSYVKLGDLPAALAASARSVEIRRGLVARGEMPADDARLGAALTNHGSLLLHDGRARGAGAVLGEAMESRRSAFGRDSHPDVGIAAGWLVAALLVLARGGDAEAGAAATRLCRDFEMDRGDLDRIAATFPDARDL